MTVSLVVEANQPPLDWSSFTSSKPPFSTALDGYVYGGPRFLETPFGPYANFNHHEEVDRLATRATCAQVLLAIRQGLFSSFRKDGQLTLTAYVNDCDEDVCLAWWLLNNHILVQNTINPLINKLVAMEDYLDTTGGSYPVCFDLPFLAEMGWIFEPYRRFRTSGGLGRKDTNEYAQVIESVGNRITAYLMGHGKNIPLDKNYHILNQGKGWSMVSEIGQHARSAMFSDGIRAFIAVSKRPNNTWTYTVCKMSQFISCFDIPKLYTSLNIAECQKRGVTSLDGDMWGGGNTIGGSPRVSGSVLAPSEVFDIVQMEIGV
jgi:hypothetical protein